MRVGRARPTDRSVLVVPQTPMCLPILSFPRFAKPAMGITMKMRRTLKIFTLFGLANLVVASSAVAASDAASGGGAPQAPAVLPGKGLAQHDFFYAGEAKQEQMFIVRNGQ